MNLTQARAAVAEAKQKISTAYQKGVKLEVIAREHGIVPQQIIHIVRAAGIPPRRPDLSTAQRKRLGFGSDASRMGALGGPVEGARLPANPLLREPRT